MSAQATLDEYDGERRMREGITLAGTGERHWIEGADRVIAHLAALGEPFTADRVRDLAGEPDHPNGLGARLALAAKRGLIEAVGIETSKRPERHLGLLRVWRGRPA